jgi:phosphoglucomutase
MSTSEELMEAVMERAKPWLKAPFDEATQQAVGELMENDTEELVECFYTDLEFGTGGLRGLMGVGVNRMNIYTVGMATQGLATYIKSCFDGDLSMAIAYDSRNNSPEFALQAARVLVGNGIKVYLFSELRPTPELSFAIRHLGCKGGIVVTASHNPKEYNGYKVYWDDGAQVVAPHDQNIISEVRKVSGYDEVKVSGDDTGIELIGTEIDEVYLGKVSELALSSEAVQRQSDMKIVYTGLHGTGITLIPAALEEAGFNEVHIVPKQDEPDGNFPTVQSPNPEEKEALDMSLELANKIQADVVLGTDPDADRVGMAVRNPEGNMVLLNGNEAATLLVYYSLSRWKELGKIDGSQFIAKTVVTSDLLSEIAQDFGVKTYETLTGFKFIAQVIRAKEGEETFITGGEESYGYLVGDFVRDKDAVISAVTLCEVAAWARDNGKSVIELLDEVYSKYGCYKESLISVKREGRKGKEEIAAMMSDLRTNPPSHLGGSAVVRVDDLQSSTSKNLLNGESRTIDLPASNVIQFFLEDGSKVTARPSGTEPKIKFYFSVKSEVIDGDVQGTRTSLEQKIEKIQHELELI